jgi:hypothetical protein
VVTGPCRWWRARGCGEGQEDLIERGPADAEVIERDLLLLEQLARLEQCARSARRRHPDELLVRVGVWRARADLG